MLRELWIENYALIEKAHLEFVPGYTVLTGETGTGKSMVVSALDLLLGARASSDRVRKGAKHAYLAARFDPVPAALRPELEEEEESLLISRTLSAAGKSKVLINDRPATLKRLRTMAEHLADLHGQHEQQNVLRAEAQRRLLDAFAGNDSLLNRYASCRNAFLEIQERRRDFLERSQRGAEEREFWAYQLRELQQAELEAGQEESLSAERRRIAGGAKLQEALAQALAALDDSSPSSGELLDQAVNRLEAASEIDPNLEELVSQLEEARVLVTESARDLTEHLEHLEADPERLDLVEERLALLASLRRKHKTDETGLLELQTILQQRLSDEENRDAVQQQLEAEHEKAARQWGKAARELTRQRKAEAVRLSKAVNRELQSLGMRGAAFHVEFTPASQGVSIGNKTYGSRGAEQLAFYLTANPGEPGGPIASIASGGEVSRVMLALKNVLRDVDPVPVILFDEIDTGIGGLVAEAVGERLSRISDARQVIVVTHSALIAGRANHHLKLSKTTGSRTTIQVDHLEGEARERELARMLAGSSQDVARKTAQTLLRGSP